MSDVARRAAENTASLIPRYRCLKDNVEWAKSLGPVCWVCESETFTVGAPKPAPGKMFEEETRAR